MLYTCKHTHTHNNANETKAGYTWYLLYCTWNLLPLTSVFWTQGFLHHSLFSGLKASYTIPLCPTCESSKTLNTGLCDSSCQVPSSSVHLFFRSSAYLKPVPSRYSNISIRCCPFLFLKHCQKIKHSLSCSHSVETVARHVHLKRNTGYSFYKIRPSPMSPARGNTMVPALASETRGYVIEIAAVLWPSAKALPMARRIFGLSLVSWEQKSHSF